MPDVAGVGVGLPGLGALGGFDGSFVEVIVGVAEAGDDEEAAEGLLVEGAASSSWHPAAPREARARPARTV